MNGDEDQASPLVSRYRVGGPLSAGWREGTLTRALELDTLCAYAVRESTSPESDIFAMALQAHLDAARAAARSDRSDPRQRFPRWRGGSLRERAMSNLDAAESQLLNFAPPAMILGQLPGLLAHVQRHLVPDDVRRIEFERLSVALGVAPGLRPGSHSSTRLDRSRKLEMIEEERGKIATAVRAAGSAAVREQIRVRSFRNVLVVTTLLMTLLAIAVALLGAWRPTLIPLCFAPESGDEAVVVCPTAQSDPFPVPSARAGADADSAAVMQDIDDAVTETVTSFDLFVVELAGLAAAAVAAAGAIRGIRGSSERYGLPVAMAVLKLPTGAITALLGLLLMRGQFVPGLSALDTSAQILAWALVFGYAQQLFTRLVDRQGQTVLDSVRGADRVAAEQGHAP
ncbi:hypothetical protein [Nocardioides sediminis]|uniref:hypothetical protein n=1 Tax=Nocardioides sediminis TaxID=433648 RepID=UPI000D30EC8F|nr:hypothetical protein [Nocardioides sediminis]